MNWDIIAGRYESNIMLISVLICTYDRGNLINDPICS